MTNHVYCGARGRADNAEAKVVVGVIGVVPVLVAHLTVVGVVVPAAAAVIAVLVAVGIPAKNFSRGLFLEFFRIYPAGFDFQRNFLSFSFLPFRHSRPLPKQLLPALRKAKPTLWFPETLLRTACIFARSLLLSL